MKRFTKPRFLLVYPIALGLFMIAETTEGQFLWGIVSVSLGMFLRFWANGYVGHVKVNRTLGEKDNVKTGQLITAGPYAYVRHPLYLGSLLIGIGFSLIMGRFWIAAAALLLLLVIYWRKMSQEEDILQHEWEEEFEKYRRAVPRFFPTWRRYPYPHGEWLWKGIAASKEFKTLTWVVVLLIVLYFREETLQEGKPLFAEHFLKHLIFLVLMIFLILGDGFYELMRHLRKPQKGALLRGERNP